MAMIGLNAGLATAFMGSLRTSSARPQQLNADLEAALLENQDLQEASPSP